MTQDTFDPFDSATNAKTPSYDLFGKVEINAWACALEKGNGKVAFDPNNPNHKRYTAIDIFIQALPEIDVKYPRQWEEHFLAEFGDWPRIVLPSIRAALPTMGSVRELNGKYARIARVPNGKKFDKKDRQTGQPTGEKADELTYKFVEFYDTEDACRAAALAANAFDPNRVNTPAAVPATDPSDAEKNTALAFLKVIVQNAAKGKLPDEAKLAVTQALTQYPTVSKFFTVDSPETVDLITHVCTPF